MALPEVFLGILPGWGGTQLLPRIAGPENAVTVIVENALNQNRMMKPKDALRLGVVDVVLDAADYLEQSLAWLAGVLDGSITVQRNEFAGATDEQWAAALERGKIIADMRTHGASPAPYRALEMIALSRTTDLTDGLAAERDGAGRPDHDRTSSGPGSTRSTWCRSAPAGRPAPPTRRWPARSPRSASSAPV